MEKALFTSRVSALKGCIKAGLMRGIGNDTITTTAMVYPVYQRGQLKGYHARVGDIDGIVMAITEQEVASHGADGID